MTFSQILYRKARFKSKTRQYKSKDLKSCPQKKGTCLKVFKTTPKKPNSAIRPVARVILSTKVSVNCHIPGITHKLRKFSTVLVRGGRAPDIPGIKYRLIRGKFDFAGLLERKTRRSTYGTRNFSKLKHFTQPA
jgi:small subunit ribosomal protein S12